MTGSYISWETNDEEGAYLIAHLYVNPAERRKGKARAMLREALDEMRKDGAYDSVILSADSESEDPNDPIELADLVDFYESEGFEVTYAGEIVAMRCEL